MATKTKREMDLPKVKLKKTTNTKKGYTTRRHGMSLKRGNFFEKGKQSNTRNGPREKKPKLHRPTVRHSSKYLNDLVKKTNKNRLSAPGPDGKEGNALILRPKDDVSDDAENDPPLGHTGEYEVTGSDNILVHKESLMTLMNTSMLNHAMYDALQPEDSKCTKTEFDLVEFRPWGFVSSVILRCKNCTYRSERTKLYEEIPSDKPGKNTAATNMRLMILLSFLPIGPTAMYLIGAGLGIRSCSLPGMQKLANRASEILQEAGSHDIRKWRQYCIQVLADRGVDNPHVLSASIDTTYHGTNKASSVTPGTGANQATSSVIENVTGQRKVIGINHVNQSCPKGSRMRTKGLNDVYCGEGGDAKHEGCTADQPLASNISEYQMAKKMAEDIYNEDGILFSVICSDSDSSAPNAFAEVFQEKAPELGEMEWCKDPWHSGKNQKFKTKYHDFAHGTFGPGLTAVKEKECAKAFAIDLVSRVSLTMKNAFEYWKDDIEKIKTFSESLTSYIIKCYVGDHSSCSWSPVAQLTGCSGSGEDKCWLKRASSPFRAISDLDFIILKRADKSFIRKVISMKLGVENLEHFKYGMSSSRNESFNRTHHHCLPKNTTFSRTSRGRVAAATGTANNNLGEFAEMAMRTANCPIAKTSVTKRLLNSYEKHRDKVRENQEKPETRARRRQLENMRVEQYFQERKTKTDTDEYRKFKLDQAIEVSNNTLQRMCDRLDNIKEVNVNFTQNVGELDVEDLDIDLCEQYIQNALSGVNQYMRVLTENIKDIDNFELKQVKRKQAATERAATKATERSTRSSTNREHSYGKV